MLSPQYACVIISGRRLAASEQNFYVLLKAMNRSTSFTICKGHKADSTSIALCISSKVELQGDKGVGRDAGKGEVSLVLSNK